MQIKQKNAIHFYVYNVTFGIATLGFKLQECDKIETFQYLKKIQMSCKYNWQLPHSSVHIDTSLKKKKKNSKLKEVVFKKNTYYLFSTQ